MTGLGAAGLACTIGGRTILTGVDLELPPGQLMAVVGPNGAGKSTLLRTIAGILPVRAGAVHIGGHDLRRLSARRRARMLAFVGQADPVAAELLVGEVVMLGRLPHRPPWALGSAQDREAVTAALSQVGLEGFDDRPASRLSGGELRRVSIARGLAQQTPVLLLDEPTNHLDVEQQLEVLAMVRSLGRTVLAAIHDLNLATRFSDRVVVLGNGTVVAHGPTPDVLTADLIRSVFRVDAMPMAAGVERQWYFSLSAEADDRDRRIVAQRGDDRAGVEDLVEPEPRRRRVR